MKNILFVCCLLFSSFIFSQDLLSLVDSTQTKSREKVSSTFKAIKVINAQTIETVKRKHLEFHIAHRFGDVATSESAHFLWGLDNVADVRFAFDYGITENFMIGIGRSKRNEFIDGNFKWRFLNQTTDNHIPVSIAFYEDVAFTPMKKESFYSGTTNVEEKTAHRFSYVSQLVIARKFSRSFSLEILPTFQHRNFVKAYINPDNGQSDENNLFAIGIAARYKITKWVSIVADYFYNTSPYRDNNSQTPYYHAFSLGVELDTGGHIFTIDFCNAPGLIENDFLVNNPSQWSKGEFKLGFNISRIFSFK